MTKSERIIELIDAVHALQAENRILRAENETMRWEMLSEQAEKVDLIWENYSLKHCADKIPAVSCGWPMDHGDWRHGRLTAEMTCIG